MFAGNPFRFTPSICTPNGQRAARILLKSFQILSTANTGQRTVQLPPPPRLSANFLLSRHTFPDEDWTTTNQAYCPTRIRLFSPWIKRIYPPLSQISLGR